MKNNVNIEERGLKYKINEFFLNDLESSFHSFERNNIIAIIFFIIHGIQIFSLNLTTEI